MSASFTVQGVTVNVRVHGHKRPYVVEKPNGRLEGIAPKGMPSLLAMSMLKPMVEEILRKRSQTPMPDVEETVVTLEEMQPKAISPSAKLGDPDEYFPAHGKLDVVVDDVPIHVKLVSRQRKYLRIFHPNLVKAYITGGSRRKNAIDFFENNIDRIKTSIVEVKDIQDISEIVIFYDSLITLNVSANDTYRTHGVKVYVRQDPNIKKDKSRFDMTDSGDIILSINDDFKITNLVAILSMNKHIVQKHIDALCVYLGKEKSEVELIKPCIVAYQDFLIEILPVKQSVSITYSIRPDGIVKAKVPAMFKAEVFSEFVKDCKNKIIELLSDKFFLKPNEQELLTSVRTLDTINCEPKPGQNFAVDKSVLERAMKYVGKGEYIVEVDGIEAKIIVENVTDGHIRKVTPKGIEMSVPASSPKSDVLNYLREMIDLLQKTVGEVKAQQHVELITEGRTTYEGYTVEVKFDGRMTRRSSIQMQPNGVMLFKTRQAMPKEKFHAMVAEFIEHIKKNKLGTDADISHDKDCEPFYSGMEFRLWGEKHILTAVEDDARAKIFDVKVDGVQKTIEVAVPTGYMFLLEAYVLRWCEHCLVIKGSEYFDKWGKEFGVTSFSLHAKAIKTKLVSSAKKWKRLTVCADLILWEPKYLEFVIARELANLADASKLQKHLNSIYKNIPDWAKIQDDLQHFLGKKGSS